ncbi:MAG: hypothetical protein MUD08_14195, partial [Cytophagales bacterium]|nr:hypothetical protein [Cytophagales bacterium]
MQDFQKKQDSPSYLSGQTLLPLEAPPTSTDCLTSAEPMGMRATLAFAPTNTHYKGESCFFWKSC